MDIDILNHINNTCDFFNIKNYTINDDGSIDVDGDVILSHQRLTELPLDFNIVSGYFDCGDNFLTTLKGSPKECHRFRCQYNNLKSLEHIPTKLNYDGEDEIYFVLNISYNPLESLKFIPLDIIDEALYLPYDFTYNYYQEYCKSYKRDLKFKKILRNI